MNGHAHHDQSHDLTDRSGKDGEQPAVADAAPGGHAAVEHAREELGAAATHGHRAIAHEKHATHEAHAGRGTSGDHGQHGGHAGHGEDMFKRPFWVSLVLTIPVLVYAELLQEVLGYTAPRFPGSAWLVPLLASVIYWYGGRVFLTGDSRDVARWVADELGIDEFFAEVLPQHKSEKIRELQSRGLRVAMVGDGVNDAPALAQADVGIAIGAGTDVARASAGIVLVKNDPRDVARVVRLSRATYRKMIQNLGWTVGYNAIPLPLAAGALAGVGIVLPAWAGALLMSLSTIIVALNAQTLRGLRLSEDGGRHENGAVAPPASPSAIG